MNLSCTYRSDSIKMQTTITNVIRTMQVCDNIRFKKIILYELFEYLCENKTHLYILGKTFGKSVEIIIDNHLNDAHTDKMTKSKLHDYKAVMEDYFKWSNKR